MWTARKKCRYWWLSAKTGKNWRVNCAALRCCLRTGCYLCNALVPFTKKARSLGYIGNMEADFRQKPLHGIAPPPCERKIPCIRCRRKKCILFDSSRRVMYPASDEMKRLLILGKDRQDEVLQEWSELHTKPDLHTKTTYQVGSAEVSSEMFHCAIQCSRLVSRKWRGRIFSCVWLGQQT